MNRVFVYVLGSLIIAGALAYGAQLMGVPIQWIILGALVVVGLGLMGAARSARGSSRAEIDVH